MAETPERRRKESVRGDILKQLFLAHATGDDAAFRKAAIQLGAEESRVGHVRLAEDLRAIVARMPLGGGPEGDTKGRATRSLRSELGDLLEMSFRRERMADIILPERTRKQLQRVILENRSGAKLEKWGIGARR